jgi:hypothetical protein
MDILISFVGTLNALFNFKTKVLRRRMSIAQLSGYLNRAYPGV